MIWLYQATFSILPILIPGTSATLKKIAKATSSDADKRCENDASAYTKSSLRDFFTVLALSFHAVFEGLAVGLETDSKDVWLLFAGNLEGRHRPRVPPAQGATAAALYFAKSR
jgi:zinc transporter ZupT